VQAAVVKMPDPLYGEWICSYSSLKPGETLNFDERVSFKREKKIASHKLPKGSEIVEQIPMVGAGTKVGQRIGGRYREAQDPALAEQGKT
jgi:non-ribosomal peptide synthetase component E (peptide arylation enzyme)